MRVTHLRNSKGAALCGNKRAALFSDDREKFGGKGTPKGLCLGCCLAVRAVDAFPAPQTTPGLLAVKAEIARLRPNYQTDTNTDAGRRQILDYLDRYIDKLLTIG